MVPLTVASALRLAVRRSRIHLLRAITSSPLLSQAYEKDGFFVGGQTQGSNPRHAYKDALWFSFPGEGLCHHPDGSHNCTYMSRYAGSVTINDLVRHTSAALQHTISLTLFLSLSLSWTP